MKVTVDWTNKKIHFELKTDNENSLKNWKSLTVISVFAAVMVTCIYAGATNDYTMYHDLLHAGTTVVASIKHEH